MDYYYNNEEVQVKDFTDEDYHVDIKTLLTRDYQHKQSAAMSDFLNHLNSGY